MRPGDTTELLEVVVRLHDPSKAFELRRALFSLVCQSYRPIVIRLVTQRFSTAQIQELANHISHTLEIDSGVGLELINYSAPEPADARSALLNLAIRDSNRRYLAFLDHDDTVFPEAYCELIDELRRSNCGIAFGSIAMKDAEVFQDALLVENRRAAFKGQDLIDLLDDNFCPIHSFVIDRRQVEPVDLQFDESLRKLEDYDFLLRLCAKYTSSFSLIGKFVGDYYIKTDGSNTLPGEANMNGERMRDFMRNKELIRKRKETCVLSAVVQRQLGFVPAIPEMTIADLLERFANRAGELVSNSGQ